MDQASPLPPCIALQSYGPRAAFGASVFALPIVAAMLVYGWSA